MLIYLYVQHEFSFDRFHPEVDRIYRVNQTFIWGENNTNQFASTGPGVAYAIREEISEVELITSIHTPGNCIISYSNASNEVISFEESKVFAADSNFFNMFHFPLLKGKMESVFTQANTLVMTESTAKKYFGDEDPIGKLVRLHGHQGENQQTYEVSGVVEDVSDNSYIQFDVLLSMKGFPIERFYWSWVWTQLETYIRLTPNANLNHVQAKLEKIPAKHTAETLKLAFNTSWNEYIQSGKKWELFLQPMTSIHLPKETVINRLNDSGNLLVIYSFIGAAIFIVLLSCVNFMNLSTAQFTRRLKEASVRKILGQNKNQLVVGYFSEAATFCFLALIIAIGLTELLLPAFNLLTNKSLQIQFLSDPTLIVGLAGLVLIMAVVSGLYPSIFLSSFNPVQTIKGKFKTGQKGKLFRNGLVVFQFSVSIILIICTAIVFLQLNFVTEKDLGFTKENLLVLNHVEGVSDGDLLVDDALQLPGIAKASRCSSVPPKIWGGDSFGIEGSENRYPINFTSSDHYYIPTLDISLVVGRNFLPDNPADIDRVIVNEAAIKKFGWSVDESAIGKKILYENESFEIIGVVGDFNYWSLANPIEPMAIFHIKTTRLYPEKRHYIVLSAKSQNSELISSTITSLNLLWKKHAGDAPFDYYFVDEAFAETFKSQQQFGQVLIVMATLAIMIACLGLLGMIVYALEQRTKEIGIRKVSGASVWDILRLISAGYTKLVVVAFIIGAPISYWLMHQWLQEFAYRVKPSPFLFLLVGLSTLLIAIIITSYHSVKAALTNPVEVLKDE